MLRPHDMVAFHIYHITHSHETLTVPSSAFGAHEMSGRRARTIPPRVGMMLCMLCSSLVASLTPSGMLHKWRTERITAFGESFDASRYHVQVLFVDDDGVRARVCEALLERVAEWADAGWWVYPSAASIGPAVRDGDGPLPSVLRNLPFKLATNRLTAPAAVLHESDVCGGYDVIVCTDLTVLERVRGFATECGGDDTVVLSACDFLATGSERLDALDDELRELVAPEYASLCNMFELPDALPSGAPDEWRRFMAASALCCASLTCFMKEAFDHYFVSAFDELLNVHYNAAEHADVTFEACELALRRHIVTGGLSAKQRRQRFEAHLEQLRVQLGMDPSARP